MRFIKIPIILLLFFWIDSASGQSLVDMIDKSEKAVFEISAYTSDGYLTGTACGFFISSDGLAITMGNLLQNADSANIKMRNGRSFQVERVISTHPPTNLTLIKVSQSRQRDFSYLMPAKQSFRENEELLAFVNESDVEDGYAIGLVQLIKYFPFVNRIGIATGNFGALSNGSALINYKGELSGILGSQDNHTKKIIFNSYLLNDSNWVSINTKLGDLKANPDRARRLNAELSLGVSFMLTEEYIESAKAYSKYLKVYPQEGNIYCLRAIARLRYNNSVGSREDFTESMKVNPNGFLQFYLKAILDIEKSRLKEAKINLELCLSRNPNYAPAIVELAKIKLSEHVDVRSIFEDLEFAIGKDSLNAEAYYEQARLLIQYSDNTDKTYETIDKAIYLNPNLPGVYSIRGTIKFSNQNFLDAINDFNKAIEKDEADVHAYFNRAVANYNIGMKEEACRDWQKAGELGNYESFKYISRYCTAVKRSVYNKR